eukprot:COSAG02_NODE_43469_length_374_cov_1.105455_1_plen_105_part_10
MSSGSGSPKESIESGAQRGRRNLGRGGVQVAVRDEDSRAHARPLGRLRELDSRPHPEEGVPDQAVATDIDLASAIVRKLREEQALRVAAENAAAAARQEAAGLRT